MSVPFYTNREMRPRLAGPSTVRLVVTAAAEPIFAGTDADTAQRLKALLHAMSTQTRRPLIDILIETIRRSAE